MSLQYAPIGSAAGERSGWDEPRGKGSSRLIGSGSRVDGKDTSANHGLERP